MPSWVGDMVMAQSLLRRLKFVHPSAVIDAIAPAYSESLFACMPDIRRVIKAPFGHGQLALIARYRLGKALRAEVYDQAFVLPNSFKSALIPWFARIPIRTGWRGEMRYGLLNDRRIMNSTRYPKMVQRYLALGFKPGEAFDEKPYWPVLTSRSQPCLEKPVLVLCPGAAYGASKRWPISYFAALAQHYLDLGWAVWCLGGPQETHLAVQLPAVDFTHTSLAEAIDLLALARVVVSNDSGLMHIASALGKPVVAIYGSTLPDHAPPLTSQARILSQSLSCKPCFKRECPFGHYNCLQRIRVKTVIDAVSELT